MSIIDVFPSDDPPSDLAELQNLLHEIGPETSQILESLSYYKSFHASEFSEIEEQIVSVLGLFYKVKKPSNLYSFLLAGIGNQH